ncbi:MAG: hypothetical protein NTY53_07315 [Kiritimatiellaeota bacterium]|nr:hypothetical protein [Kiritimatiellota bacterium]
MELWLPSFSRHWKTAALFFPRLGRIGQDERDGQDTHPVNPAILSLVFQTLENINAVPNYLPASHVSPCQASAASVTCVMAKNLRLQKTTLGSLLFE